MRAANVPHRSNRAVITPTGLDIHRYICSVWLAAGRADDDVSRGLGWLGDRKKCINSALAGQ